jgi:hypothetical protein
MSSKVTIHNTGHPIEVSLKGETTTIPPNSGPREFTIDGMDMMEISEMLEDQPDIPPMETTTNIEPKKPEPDYTPSPPQLADTLNPGKVYRDEDVAKAKIADTANNNITPTVNSPELAGKLEALKTDSTPPATPQTTAADNTLDQI